jgi:hypothetical protein
VKLSYLLVRASQARLVSCCLFVSYIGGDVVVTDFVHELLKFLTHFMRPVKGALVNAKRVVNGSPFVLVEKVNVFVHVKLPR